MPNLYSFVQRPKVKQEGETTPTPSEARKSEVPAPTIYNPGEVIGLFTEAIAKRSPGVIHVRGIYHPGKGVLYGGYYYDILHDELSSKELSIMVSPHIRVQLVDGNLVDLKGLVERRVTNDCSVRLLLQVTGMSVVQEQTVSEEDMKRIEIRNGKAKAGFKNVDGILESAIYADRRPSVGLIFADSSITDADFNSGKEAAGTMVDFWEYRVSFARPDAFVQKLRDVDGNGHDCICIVRGGGAGLEALDNLSVLECVAGMKTAVITAVGHTVDKVFINEIADLEIGTPSLLGSYFQNLVENVSKKKADSTAALTRKIEAQFKQQIENAKKQNEELQKQLAGLRDATTKAQALHDAQVKAAQGQLTKIVETNKAQSDALTVKIGKMQETIETLTKQNQTLNSRYSDEKARKEVLERDLREAQKKGSKEGLIIAIIILSILLIVSLILR